MSYISTTQAQLGRFQSAPLAWRAILIEALEGVTYESFNPRSRGGRSLAAYLLARSPKSFNPRSRVEGDHCFQELWRPAVEFQSAPRVGAIAYSRQPVSPLIAFQSAPPRVEGD